MNAFSEASTTRGLPAHLPWSAYPEHAEDVLERWLAWTKDGSAALVAVTRTDGGGVRAPGALMAVSASGDRAGYISGGCIDADVVLRARQALRSQKPLLLRYGAGSPFIDLPLPCGGMIEVMIIPQANRHILQACHAQLVSRKPASLCLAPPGTVIEPHRPDAGFRFRYEPRMRLRIAGRGADCLALARLATASGIDTALYLRDDQDLDEARRSGFAKLTAFGAQSAPPPLQDDPWTAFLLAFHDADRESALLMQALDGPAFYIGAVGSRKTHTRRCDQLRVNGIAAAQIERIRGPVGLIPSMRDASMLALSILAEIVQAFHDSIRQRFTRTALVLLAAGRSSRFEGGDKLLAPLGDRPLIAHSAALLGAEPVAARIAVIGPDQPERAAALRLAGWSIVINGDAATGLASSLAAGIRAAAETGAADAAMVLLADMPDVPEQHLVHLREALTPDKSAVMSTRGQALSPPAIFARSTFEQLTVLRGDAGARQVFDTLDKTATVSLPSGAGIDIDTREDLEELAARHRQPS